MFYKKATQKNFAIFTGEHLCWSFFLIKLQVFSCEYCAILKNIYSEEHLCTAASNYGNWAMFFEKICYTE